MSGYTIHIESTDDYFDLVEALATAGQDKRKLIVFVETYARPKMLHLPGCTHLYDESPEYGGFVRASSQQLAELELCATCRGVVARRYGS